MVKVYTHSKVVSYEPKTKKWLQSMGWKEGDGLGKNGQGNPDFVKVKKKADRCGIGQDKSKGEDWSNSWWEDNYANALNKVKARGKRGASSSTSSSDDSSDSSLSGADGCTVTNNKLVRTAKKSTSKKPEYYHGLFVNSKESSKAEITKRMSVKSISKKKKKRARQQQQLESSSSSSSSSTSSSSSSGAKLRKQRVKETVTVANESVDQLLTATNGRMLGQFGAVGWTSKHERIAKQEASFREQQKQKQKQQQQQQQALSKSVTHQIFTTQTTTQRTEQTTIQTSTNLIVSNTKTRKEKRKSSKKDEEKNKKRRKKE